MTSFILLLMLVSKCLNRLNHFFLPGQPTERHRQYSFELSLLKSCHSGSLVYTMFAQESDPSLCHSHVDMTVASNIPHAHSHILVSFTAHIQLIPVANLLEGSTQVNLPYSVIDPIFVQHLISIYNTRSIFQFIQEHNVAVSTDPQVIANHSHGPKIPHTTSITSCHPQRPHQYPNRQYHPHQHHHYHQHKYTNQHPKTCPPVAQYPHLVQVPDTLHLHHHISASCHLNLSHLYRIFSGCGSGGLPYHPHNNNQRRSPSRGTSEGITPQRSA